jgi:hypothetical protein
LKTLSSLHLASRFLFPRGIHSSGDSRGVPTWPLRNRCQRGTSRCRACLRATLWPWSHTQEYDNAAILDRWASSKWANTKRWLRFEAPHASESCNHGMEPTNQASQGGCDDRRTETFDTQTLQIPPEATQRASNSWNQHRRLYGMNNHYSH